MRLNLMFAAALLVGAGAWLQAMAGDPLAQAKPVQPATQAATVGASSANLPVDAQNTGEASAAVGAHLGVETEVVSPVVAAQLPHLIRRGAGVAVVSVEPGSPADGRLQLHDVLLLYDNQILVHPLQVTVLLWQDQPSRPVVFQLVRRGELHTITVPLGKMAATPQLAVTSSTPAPVVPPSIKTHPAASQAGAFHRPASSVGATVVNTPDGIVTINEIDGLIRAAIAVRGRQPYEFRGDRKQLDVHLQQMPAALAQAVRDTLAGSISNPYHHGNPFIGMPRVH